MSNSTATHDSIEPEPRNARVQCTDGSDTHMMYKRGRKTISVDDGEDKDRKLKEYKCVKCGIVQYDPPNND